MFPEGEDSCGDHGPYTSAMTRREDHKDMCGHWGGRKEKKVWYVT